VHWKSQLTDRGMPQRARQMKDESWRAVNGIVQGIRMVKLRSLNCVLVVICTGARACNKRPEAEHSGDDVLAAG
jgi:hypothetical protein